MKWDIDLTFTIKLYFMNQKLRSFLLHHVSSLLLLFLLFLGGCKKEAVVFMNPDQADVGVRQKFFSAPADLSDNLKNIIEKIKSQDEAHQFVPDMAKKIGYPNWQASVESDKAKSQVATRSLDSSVTIIPFNHNNLVSAYLVCVQANDSFYFRIESRSALFAHNFIATVDSARNRKQIAKLSTLAYFEKKCFNRDSLLVNNAYVKKIKNASLNFLGFAPSGLTGRFGLITVEICGLVYVPNPWYYIPGEGGYHEEWQCTYYSYYGYMEETEDAGGGSGTSGTNDDWWNGYSSGSGGGSGGSGPSIQTFSDFAVPPFIWNYLGDDGTVFIDPNSQMEPDFQFDPNDNYTTLYPNFTTMVKGLKTFVKDNGVVLNALQKWSGFSKQQIIGHLTFGNGPLVKVEEMVGRFGYYSKNNGNKTLHIRASFVRGLEQSVLQSTKEATAFLLAVTILHEYIHYGTSRNNISEGVYDFGFGFERDAFNMIVDDDNAGNVVIKFSNYF
jgi:hypothetical protein